MISIKKRLLNVCNRLISPIKSNEPTTNSCKKQLKLKRHSRKSSTLLSKSISSCSIDSRSKSRKPKSSSSSGYGTSIKSTQSVFMNLDNYFYDENFAKLKDKASENTKQIKLDVIQHLLDYQIEYVNILKLGLERHIRPLSALMSGKLYFEIFQNIEKIFTTTEFIRNSINESLLVTMDLYASTLTVIHEYIQVIANIYDFYLKGYAQAAFSITDKEFSDLLQVLNKTSLMSEFNLSEFIDLPIKNIAKIYCTFMSLLEMTPSSEEHDFERLTQICQLIKQLIEPSLNSSLCDSFDLRDDMSNLNSILENNLFKKKTQHVKSQLRTTKQRKHVHHRSSRIQSPSLLDYTDLDGNKYYFV